MGTRGTLHIYVNGELKVRQYNQWDSYPTGQFQAICEYFRENKEGLKNLAYRLINSRFTTKEEVQKIFFDEKRLENLMQDSQIRTLTNRDIGSDILYLLSGMPLPYDGLVIPDWMYVLEETFPEEEDPMKVRLPPEEGNYVIEIECELDESDRISSRKYLKRGSQVRFRLSGEYWGVERSFDWMYVPTDEEVKAWEQEARKED